MRVFKVRLVTIILGVVLGSIELTLLILDMKNSGIFMVIVDAINLALHPIFDCYCAFTYYNYAIYLEEIVPPETKPEP